MLVYGKCECFACRCCMFVSCVHTVAVLNAALHDLQFVNAGRGCKRQPYRRGILQSWSHDRLVGSYECLLLFPHAVAVSVFIICKGLCVCVLRCCECLCCI